MRNLIAGVQGYPNTREHFMDLLERSLHTP